MPKLKTRTIIPTIEEDAAINAGAFADSNAIPYSDAEWKKVKPVRVRGRPIGSGSKAQLTVRFDIEVIEAFKVHGSGWQTKMNDALKEWLATHRA